MKTNLDSLFKTNKKMEEEGIWFDISETVGFKVKRISQAKINKIIAIKYKKFARQFSLGTMKKDLENKIMAEIFVDHFLVDWQGVEIDGEPTDLDRDIAVKMFSGMTDLLDSLLASASSMESFKEDLGN